MKPHKATEKTKYYKSSMKTFRIMYRDAWSLIEPQSLNTAGAAWGPLNYSVEMHAAAWKPLKSCLELHGAAE